MNSLFPSDVVQVTDDAEGGVRYWDALLDADLATRCFDELVAHADWHAESRPMYDRIVLVPRLTAAYRTDAIPAGLSSLGTVLQRVRSKLDAPFNTVGLNFYRDGRDSVAMHHDKLPSLVAPYPIAIVSLGHARRMDIRTKAIPRRTARIELAPGSLLSMSHASQTTHEHGIPKSNGAVGARISVVFRVRP